MLIQIFTIDLSKAFDLLEVNLAKQTGMDNPDLNIWFDKSIWYAGSQFGN